MRPYLGQARGSLGGDMQANAMHLLPFGSAFLQVQSLSEPETGGEGVVILEQASRWPH